MQIKKDDKNVIDFKMVGNRIRKIRKLRKITQSELAAACGCTNNHLSAIENGINKPSIELIMKISLILDASVDYFLMDSEYAHPKYLIDSQIAHKLEKCNTQALQIINNIIDSMLEYPGFVSNDD